MKKTRFIKPCIVALAGALSFSCIDNTYDLSTISTKMELFGNSLALPIGYTTVYLDSIIGGLGVDASTLSVDDGVYIFHYSGSMDMGGLTASLSNFNLKSVAQSDGYIDLYDATGISLPYDLPAMNYTYNKVLSVDMPDFSTDLISIDSLELTNTTMHISFDQSEMGFTGANLGDIIKIKFTPVGNGADYYINNEKVTSWDVNFGESSDVEIRMIRPSSGGSGLNINETVTVSIANMGDVQVNRAKNRLKCSMTLDNVDFNEVYGKVTYSKPAANLDPISFDALGSILEDNDVLSFYNPKITLSTSGNIGVPVDFTMSMGTSNSKTSESRSITDTTFRMVPAANAQETKVNTFVIDRTNGTSDLFKINPDQITMGYSFATDPTTATNHFIAKSSQLTMNYAMEIPLQFGNDLQLNMGSIMESPMGDLSILDDQGDLALGLAITATNSIPLNLKLKLTALDKDSADLFTAESDTIKAAPVGDLGKSTGVTTTNTNLTLSSSDLNKLKDTKKFRIGFEITNNQSPYVAVQNTDSIGIKVGVLMKNGLIINLDKSADNENE